MIRKIIRAIKMHFEEKRNWNMKMEEPLSIHIISNGCTDDKTANADEDKQAGYPLPSTKESVEAYLNNKEKGN